jgi:uncharacterized membrane protein YoaT (DUF817 family)
MPLRALDAHLLAPPARSDLSGLRRALVELWYFGLKEVRACLFAGLFFAAVFAVPRASVTFRLFDRDRSMPLLASFLLIGFFVWLAENISTLFGVWRYPNQLGAWTAVHVGKWSSWSLLVVMTFTIVANLKHIKERVHVPA